jgi:GxxExxY protein
MAENEIAAIVVDCCYRIHTQLGPGLLESVYERIRTQESRVSVVRQVPVPVVYDQLRFEEGFRADMIVNGIAILELKSVEHTGPAHKKQLITYLKLTGLKLGFLINFGPPLIKDGITRLVNKL